MKTGMLYYPNGQLRFVGRYDDTKLDTDGQHYLFFAGVKFREDGTLWCEGIFQHGGLYYGRLYYPSGNLKFIGQFNDKHGTITGRKTEGYYGPSYPVNGTFYAEDGSILYQGTFRIQKQGSIGYPKVVVPEGFGSLT